MAFIKIFLKKVLILKSADYNKSMKNFPACRVNKNSVVFKNNML